ncbi:hypothetical protein J6590_000175 [Homalodisca vitripennis]|nr:hypothetical protein J6590_000175 [Homalodisca vitripennis]
MSNWAIYCFIRVHEDRGALRSSSLGSTTGPDQTLPNLQITIGCRQCTGRGRSVGFDKVTDLGLHVISSHDTEAADRGRDSSEGATKVAHEINKNLTLTGRTQGRGRCAGAIVSASFALAARQDPVPAPSPHSPVATSLVLNEYKYLLRKSRLSPEDVHLRCVIGRFTNSSE